MLKNKLLCIVVIVWVEFISNPVLAESLDRVYWIAADEVVWDYAPSFPINPMPDKGFTTDQRVYVEQGIGRRYLKSVYREYTEGFGALKQRGAREAHLGILGPVIRASRQVFIRMVSFIPVRMKVLPIHLKRGQSS